MVGDNDAGAFATYGQAGQDYGTRLLWTLLLLVPVLYVNQEMVLRLGAVTGVGHARLILERFGKFWGAFSVIDLFILNALTIITEFIGITLAAGYLGLPKIAAVALAALVIIGSAFTGSFRRFERMAMVAVRGLAAADPDLLPRAPGRLADGARLRDPGHARRGRAAGHGDAAGHRDRRHHGRPVAAVLPAELRHRQADHAAVHPVREGRPVDRHRGGDPRGRRDHGLHRRRVRGPRRRAFTDAADLAAGLQAQAGRVAGVLFAVALLDASIIGAFAVSLSTAYAIGDVFGLKHSLHRGVKGAKGFYAIYGGLVLAAAAVVLIPGSPLGLLTEGVQALAGVLLPSAAVYLLLLCNDRDVLGPWVNGRRTNLFTGSVVAVLVALSVILTASVLDPGLTARQIVMILGGCVAAAALARPRLRGPPGAAGRPRPGPGAAIDRAGQENWRMPPLTLLRRPPVPARPQDRHVGAAVLPGRGHGPGRREDRAARPGPLTLPAARPALPPPATWVPGPRRLPLAQRPARRRPSSSPGPAGTAPRPAEAGRGRLRDQECAGRSDGAG